MVIFVVPLTFIVVIEYSLTRLCSESRDHLFYAHEYCISMCTLQHRHLRSSNVYDNTHTCCFGHKCRYPYSLTIFAVSMFSPWHFYFNITYLHYSALQYKTTCFYFFLQYFQMHGNTYHNIIHFICSISPCTE